MRRDVLHITAFVAIQDKLLEAYGIPQIQRGWAYQKMDFFWIAQVVHRILRSILWKREKRIDHQIEQLKGKISSVKINRLKRKEIR
ncbi:MAG: hypothetical protein FJY98_01855 [Candidatus Liptonbacteria bacterium]|nr:hypothetical protein [Candidatus Liptonbacteria bacterium]